MKHVWLAGIAVVLASCVTSPTAYRAPMVETPTTSLTISRGNGSSVAGAGGAAFFLTDTPLCRDQHLIANLRWATPYERTVRIPVDRRVGVHVVMNYIVPTGEICSVTECVPDEVERTCDGWASFTPRSGHDYAIVQEAPLGGECKIRVTDKATGQAPPDLQSGDPACLDLIDP